MVPGVVAGEYPREDAEIDAAALAARAGARVVHARLHAVDAAARRLELEGHDALPYDVGSLNLGSAPAGLEAPGVANVALPVRPIAPFLDRIAAPGPGSGLHRLLVVGGGAAGVELAFALRRASRQSVGIVEGGQAILPRASAALRVRVERQAARTGIALHCGRRVVGADRRLVDLDGGCRLDFDQLVWTAGAAPPPALARSFLPSDAGGFVLVDRTLQVRGHPELFAAGDCATLADAPNVPKAGVYAVREGPVLAFNLRAALGRRPLRRYRPQRDFLTLVNLGDGTAVGARGRVAFAGRWVRRLKDRIDRRFVARYRVPSPA
jgi:selenide,water dikinase